MCSVEPYVECRRNESGHFTIAFPNHQFDSSVEIKLTPQTIAFQGLLNVNNEVIVLMKGADKIEIELFKNYYTNDTFIAALNAAKAHDFVSDQPVDNPLKFIVRTVNQKTYVTIAIRNTFESTSQNPWSLRLSPAISRKLGVANDVPWIVDKRSNPSSTSAQIPSSYKHLHDCEYPLDLTADLANPTLEIAESEYLIADTNMTWCSRQQGSITSDNNTSLLAKFNTENRTFLPNTEYLWKLVKTKTKRFRRNTVNVQIALLTSLGEPYPLADRALLTGFFRFDFVPDAQYVGHNG